MTDLEITRLCAMAMEYEIVSNDPNWTAGLMRTDVAHHPGTIMIKSSRVYPHIYRPLHDDAQCFALAKTDPGLFADVVQEWRHTGGDINRALCTAFAHKQQAKVKP